MQGFSGKINNRTTGVISTPPFLTNSTFNRGESIMAERSISKVCVVEDCGKKVIGWGWCERHYRSWYKYNDPLHVDLVPRNVSLPEELFWSKVAITANPDKCWEWQACKTASGYGKLTYKRISYVAHRFAWFLTYGRLPEKLLLHSCDNRPCVNPRHLREGTYKDNSDDMVSRHRHRTGESHSFAKLTEADLDRIEALLKTDITQRQIARMHSVTESVITEIKKGRTWKHRRTQ
jgi:hypothetical protein